MHLRNGLLAACAILAGAPLWAEEPAPTVAPENLHRWVAELNDDDYHVREQAARRLTAAGPAAIGELVQGLASDQAEVAWRCGAALEEIALAGNDATVERIVRELDAACAKTGREGLKSLAKDLHTRQKQFRRQRAIAQIRKNGGQIVGTGIDGAVDEELAGGFAFAGPGPVMIIDEGFMEVDAVAMPLGMEEFAPELPRAEVFEVFTEIGRALGRALAPAARPVPVPLADLEVPLPQDAEKAVVAKEAAEAARAAAEAAEEATEAAAEAAAEAATDLAKALEDVAKEPPAKVIPLEADIAVADIGVAEMVMADAAFGIDPGLATGSWAQLSLDANWRGGDDGLSVVKDLPELTRIDLNSTKLTDKALVHLAQIRGLQQVNVYRAGFSRDGLLKFHRQRPNVVVYARGDGMMGIHGDMSSSPLVLTAVHDGSGAAKAGLQTGDIIHEIDGAKIRDFSELTICVSVKQPGETISVEYEREGKKQKVQVTLSPRIE